MSPALLALIVAGALALLVASRGDLVERDGQATTYLLTGRADVPRGLVQDDVVVVSGTATVAGTVEDDVLVLNGRVRITGTVHGDVTVLRGGARIGPEADIGGDLRTSVPARIADGAVVAGDVGTTSLLDGARGLPRAFWFGLWLTAGLAVLAAGFVLAGPARSAARRGAARPARAVVLGGLALVLAPVVVGVLAASLLGLGAALVLGSALVVAAAVGSAAGGVALGRQVGLPDGPVSLLAGWAALGATLAAALLISPILAALGGAVVVAFGLGALVPEGEAPAPPEPAPDAEDDDEPLVLASFPIGASTAD